MGLSADDLQLVLSAFGNEDKRMKYIGLDPATNKTGYSYFENQRVLEWGCWNVSEEKDWRKRIVQLATNIDELIKRTDVDVVYCEDALPTINNSQTVKMLSALHGAIILVCALNNVEAVFVPVETWKSQIGINLSHSKEYKDGKKNLLGDIRIYSKYIKLYEKKMSVDLANKLFGIDGVHLDYRSGESKFNQDDISDSMMIAFSQAYPELCKYSLESFGDIVEKLRAKCYANREVYKRGFN